MKEKRQLKWQVWAIGVVIAVIVGGGAVWLWQNPQSQASQKTVTQTVKASHAKVTKVAKKVRPVSLQKRLTHRWQTAVPAKQPKVDVAVYAPATKQTYHYTNQSHVTTYCAASTIKVGILVQLLHQRDQGVVTLSGNDQQQAAQMIQQSDNDSADYLLFDRLGGSAALVSLYQNLGMTHSHAAPVNWGLSTTTAADQLQLLKVIFYPNHYLSSASRQYAQRLMGTVASDQAWGVSKGAQHFELKNGWLDADDAGHWAVNSVGHVVEATGNRQGYLLAIYTNDDVDEVSGIRLVNRIAQATNVELGK